MDRHEEAFEFGQPAALHQWLKLLFHFIRIDLSQMSQNPADLLLAVSLYDIVFPQLDLGLKMVEGERVPAEQKESEGSILSQITSLLPDSFGGGFVIHFR